MCLKVKNRVFPRASKKSTIMARGIKNFHLRLLRVRLHKKWQKSRPGSFTRGIWHFYGPPGHVFICDGGENFENWNLHCIWRELAENLNTHKEATSRVDLDQRRILRQPLCKWEENGHTFLYTQTSKLLFCESGGSLIRLFLFPLGNKALQTRSSPATHAVTSSSSRSCMTYIFIEYQSEFIYQSRNKLPLSKAQR